MLSQLKIAAAAVALLVLVGGYIWADHSGYNRAATEWSAKYSAREAELNKQRFDEAARQAAANDAAKATEQARITQLQTDMAALQQKLKEQADAADKDPDRDRVGLNVDSVRRIDGIGGTK